MNCRGAISFEAAEVARLLTEHPDTAAVFATLQETSTGVGHDIEAIGRVVRSWSSGFSRSHVNTPPKGVTPAPGDVLFIVDGISGAGAMECRTDDWGIDVLVVGSQKALTMTPPGFAFLAVSPKAWQRIEPLDRPAFYFDLLAYREAAKANETPFTPAIPLVEALAESLQLIRAEGIENVWARSRRLSRAVLAGVAALGLRPVAKRPAEGVSAIYLPEAIDGKAFLARLEERLRHQAGRRARTAQGKDLPHRSDGPARRGRHSFLPCRERVGSSGNGTCGEVGVSSTNRRIDACGFAKAVTISDRSQPHDGA